MFCRKAAHLNSHCQDYGSCPDYRFISFRQRIGKIKKENEKQSRLPTPSIYSFKGLWYSQAGMYFIAIGIQNYQWLFGEIREETMHLNDAGKMIEKWYWKLFNKYPDIQCDEYIIMPNHIHFIIHKIDQNKSDKQKINNPLGANLRVCLPLVHSIHIRTLIFYRL